MNRENGYVSVDLVFHQSETISELLTQHGVTPIETGEFHCTIAYDKTLGHDALPVEMDMDRIYEGKVIGVELLGEEKDGLQSAIALVLDAPQLEELHHQFLAAGYDHGWDTYKAHMSVAYDVPVEDATRMVDILQVFVGDTFYFSNLSAEPVK